MPEHFRPAKAGAEEGLRTWLAPARTALVIVDMQTDFAAPDGAMGQAGADLSAVPAALAAAGRLADAARRAGAPVIFVGLMTAPEDDSAAWAERLRRQGASDAASELALCRAGTRGAAFVGPIPLAGEAVVPKLRYSGFFRTDLDARLRRLGVDTLVVAGLTTGACVDSTVRDAFHLDYHVFVATDACAAYEADLHAATLKTLALNCAILVTTDEVAEAWG
jgi:nicotinamidase-related amidase